MIGDATGTILFGGIDTSKYTGKLTTIDLVAPAQSSSSSGQTSNAIAQFTVVVTGVSLSSNGKSTTYLSNGDATGQDTSKSLTVLVDTGSAAWTVPETLYDAMVKVFGNDLDQQGDLPCSYQDNDISITIEFGGLQSITVPIKNFVVPIYDPSNNQQYTEQDGSPACTLLLAPDSGGQQQQESGFLTLGDSVMRSMYVVFDLDNGQLSIAQANVNASTDAASSGTGDNIKVVKAGANSTLR